MSTPEAPQDPTQPPAAAPYPPAPPAAAPYPTQPPAAPATPGKGLSIAAIILAFLVPVVGLILGIVAMVQSKKAGHKNGLALAAVIIGAVLTVAWVAFFMISALLIGSVVAAGGEAVMEVVTACQNGAESVTFEGQTISCEDVLASIE